ncbi:HNH endonuclease [Kitasatospora sp. NPDC001095]
MKGAPCAVSTASRPRLTEGAAKPTTGPTKPAPRSGRRLQALVSRHYSGAERLRQRIDRAGSAVCGLCGEGFPAELVDVDHRTPLALGGEDTDDNVWPLCRTCHRGKTRTDFGTTVPPF